MDRSDRYTVAGALLLGMTCALPQGASAQQVDRVSCSDIASAVASDRRGGCSCGGYRVRQSRAGMARGHAHSGDLAIARRLADGRIDSSFGETGSVRADLGDFDDAQAVLVRPGVIDVEGTSSPRAGDRRGPADVVVLRLDERGAPTPASATTVS